MFMNLFDTVNMDQLEILGMDRQMIHNALFFLSTILLSLFIHIFMYLLVKQRLLFVLFYIISSSSLFIFKWLLPFEAVQGLNTVSIIHVLVIYGFCNALYLLFRHFLSYKKSMVK